MLSNKEGRQDMLKGKESNKCRQEGRLDIKSTSSETKCKYDAFSKNPFIHFRLAPVNRDKQLTLIAIEEAYVS